MVQQVYSKDRIYLDLRDAISDIVEISPINIRKASNIKYELGLDSLDLRELIVILQEKDDVYYKLNEHDIIDYCDNNLEKLINHIYEELN